MFSKKVVDICLDMILHLKKRHFYNMLCVNLFRKVMQSNYVLGTKILISYVS